ncbi:hypothetical protein C7957_10653 [Halanaerobium saccharolyticum]|uniref:Uncharacterized protein n=1 Tax=Halanaerobium saccharolyticum TaxID=43595 RepID=A0A4V3CZ76_9FIRM|nr:hypothetical protein [Halanaerobium saccharolyticum]TDP96958.1 hypothetical protein C7957_10653 [Halanaerobium saccharolyticum]
MQFKNEEGAALVLVLLFLLIGTILVGTIITTARNHINIAVQKEGISKAFHNAESGVEYVRANIDDIVSDGIEKIDSEDLNLESDNIKFEIIKENGGNKFTSRGFYGTSSGKEFKQEITFNITYSLGNANKTFNLEADIEGDEPTANEMNSLLHSQAQILFPTFISISSEIKPNWDDWEEIRDDSEGWNGDSNLSEQIVTFNSSNNGNGNNNNKGNGNNNNNGNNDKYKITDSISVKNSIIFVDGDLEINPHIDWGNSIIITNGTLKFNGTPNSSLKNSIFFVYNKDNENNNVLHTAGQIDFEEWELELDFEELDFEKLPVDFNKENSIFLEKEVTNWRQL